MYSYTFGGGSSGTSYVISFEDHLVGSQALWGLPRCNLKLTPHIDGRERLKKESSQSRLAGDRFNNQGNLHMRLVLATRLVDLCTHPQNLTSLCRGLTWIQSHNTI